jgi:1,4-alpha-glucan branching enzyme
MYSSSAPSSGSANRYSAKKNKKPVNFACVAPEAKSVALIGDFNDWHPNANPMTHRPDGTWTAQVQLSHGPHRYLFFVDGQPVNDPKAQGIVRNEKNERLSLITVS